jgi:hypothetical protein
MNAPLAVDSLLVQWGDRLFYPGNRRTPAGPSGRRSEGLHDRAARVRARIAATVARHAPQVVVKVTGGGRGLGAIAAHFRYISKGGRLAFEDDRGVVRDGKEALRDLAEQWRRGGTRIPGHSERREAFNIMLSMPTGTNSEIVRNAAREFAQAELAGHRYVMVLHTHQANPHVHLSARAEGRDGRRLNPRKEDLRRWREVFAEKLRGWGIEAEALSKITRGSRHRNEGLGQRKAREQGRGVEPGLGEAVKLTPARRQVAVAWCEIAKALASSDDPADRRLGQSVVDFARWLPGVRFKPNEKLPQRESPGMDRTPVQRTRPEPGWER